MKTRRRLFGRRKGRKVPFLARGKEAIGSVSINGRQRSSRISPRERGRGRGGTFRGKIGNTTDPVRPRAERRSHRCSSLEGEGGERNIIAFTGAGRDTIGLVFAVLRVTKVQVKVPFGPFSGRQTE